MSGGWQGHTVRRLRSETIARWGSVCWLCGQPIDLTLPRTEPGGFTVDHVVPRSKGGSNDVANCRPAHRSCNVRRQDKQARPMRPARAPVFRSAWPGI